MYHSSLDKRSIQNDQNSIDTHSICPFGFKPTHPELVCRGKGVCCISSEDSDCCNECTKNRCEGVGGRWIALYSKKSNFQTTSCKSRSACLIGKIMKSFSGYVTAHLCLGYKLYTLDIKLIISDCSYKKLKSVVITEGYTLGSYETSSSEECRGKCDQTEQCFNFRFCSRENKCKLFQRMLSGSEPQAEPDGKCSTFYKKCNSKTD